MSLTKLNRRDLCSRGSGVLLAFSGGVLRPLDRAAQFGDGEAYSLWRLWNDPALTGTPLALVAAAVLAANPHDTQPWLFRVRENSIEIYADLSRNLGAMDPYVREMHLGLGCAIENLLLAARPNGYAAEPHVEGGSLLDLSARRGRVLAATVALEKASPLAPDSLYRAIPNRHTNRYAYDRARGLPSEWRAFAAHANVSDDVRMFLFADGPERRLFDQLIVDATAAIIADKSMIADSDRWLRMSPAEIEAHRDGPTLEAAGLSPLTLFFARIFPVSDETAHETWLSNTRDKQVATAPMLGLIAVRNRYDRTSAIAAGRTWQRLHLSATVEGIAMQPLNQPIEMVDRERQRGAGKNWANRLAQLTGQGWEATFAFRAGYATDAAPASPRRALHDVLFSSSN